MEAFKGLLQKEIKLTKNWFLTGIALQIIAYLTGIGLAGYFNEPIIPMIMSYVVFFIHAFYLPAYLLTSLNIEGQTQLWLHNPNSGTKLLLAKLAAGFVFFLISILFSMLVTKWQLLFSIQSDHFIRFTGGFVPNLLLTSAGIASFSIYLGIWVLFYWSLYHSLKSVPVLKKFRWPILIIIWNVLQIIGTSLEKLPLYKKIINIGVIHLNQKNPMQFNAGNSSIGFHDVTKIPTMSLLIFAGIAIIVFYIAVWLLERKVEV
ncbi:hypothetical protein F7731_03725 [Cytobacillus depressus]|uniref:Uncharacterized protein n=1 Tax=Cytobacillus depressus TaxID=1602942 RepID=A0A6L3VAH0_9BACI|nr:hypothetical protein [Cytobacillus depressus]KAB2338671.1 hypothetical protein F7731_03725 [Cytobacillus depressus]